jgi:hypothetical protein
MVRDEINRFGDDHLVWNIINKDHFVDAEAECAAIHGRHPIQRPTEGICAQQLVYMCLVGDCPGDEHTDVGVQTWLAFGGSAFLRRCKHIKGRDATLICLEEDIERAFTGLTSGPHR